MVSCQEILKGALGVILEGEQGEVLDTISWALSRLIDGRGVKTHEVIERPEGMDALLLMDEWRLVQMVGASLTKAWEDNSQLLSTRGDLELVIPAWLKTLLKLACDSGKLSFRSAIMNLFSNENQPAWLKMPKFLFEMALISDHGIIDSALINRLLRDTPLGIPPDTLIAQLKNYGFISPHLRADFFRMQTPHYEIHPLIVYASTHRTDWNNAAQTKRRLTEKT